MGLLSKVKDVFTDIFAGPQKAAATEREASFSHARAASEELSATKQVATSKKFEDALLGDVMPTNELVGSQVGASLGRHSPLLSSAFQQYVPQAAGQGFAKSVAPQAGSELQRSLAAALSGQPLPVSPDYSKAGSDLFKSLEIAFLPKEY